MNKQEERGCDSEGTDYEQSILSKSFQIDRDDWANVCAEAVAVNLTILLPYFKPEMMPVAVV